MARRGDPDPLLLQTVSERLARLLAEHEPRRAVADPPAGSGGDDRAGSAPAAIGAPAEDVDALPPPRRFGRAHLGVVAVVLLLGVLVAAWSLVRARPVALAAPEPSTVVVTEQAPSASASARATPSADPGAGTGPAAELVVHVLGAVRRPGLVRLPGPARVQDAVDAAGGLTRAADPGELNLAQLLTDGQQVVIGTRDDPDGEVRGSGGGPSGDSSGAGGGVGPVLDLNSADATRLEELPGVGPVTAAKIVAWRDEHGRFSRVEELQEVDGIGPKTYAEIAPHVRV
ncbi:competence protein ComEA [Friedmanniella luteola]|uniref:Competence protein ComEA n=1 Tax=Friedmanniella luteola TaxID=546871 RepID=A0A1H1X9K3_9ACTN|nr:helix-hairpin-helix domain-containing protein [Friedmanniella luteola]SDT05339.1 competence protein ComEA [Friedmanniella luteola]